MLILAPVPSLMQGESDGETLWPDRALTNFGDWFTGTSAEWPSAYTHIERCARELMPDFMDIQNPLKR